MNDDWMSKLPKEGQSDANDVSNESTMKIPAQRRTDASGRPDDSNGSNDKTIKIPPQMRGWRGIGEKSKQQVSGQLEYTWENSQATSASSIEHVLPPLPPLPPQPQPQSIAPQPLQPPPPRALRSLKKKRWPRWARILTAVLLVLLVVGGGALAYGYYYFDTNVQQPLAKFIRPVSRGKDEPAGNSSPIPSDSSVAGRVWNILLLGSDNDGKYSFPALLTQVMMVVHVDTINNNVTMVSIPRDSWVYVPEVGGMHKIDQAFFIGAAQRSSFDDGVRLARLTVEKDYGITIDRYAWVGLAGFAKVIDTLGGLDIDITHPVVDDTYPDDTGSNANNPNAYKRLYLAPGPQHLSGLQALEYVRSRHADLVGDIGRTQRQQQVLTALKQKLSVASVLGNLHALIADLTGSVYTDLSEQEMLGFASFGHGLDSNTIQRITLGPGVGSQDYGDYGTVYDPSVGSNQDIVMPHCENIQPLINHIFGLGDVQSCHVNG